MTAYTKGRNFEYKVRDDLIEKGYYVTRSAGSKGLIDLVAIHPKNKTIMVQCKYGTKPVLAEMSNLCHFARDYANTVAVFVAHAEPRKPISYYHIPDYVKCEI